MNPLNVLTGASLMTPASAMARRGAEVLLDREQRVVLTLGPDGGPRSVTIVDRPARLIAYPDGCGPSRLDRSAVVLAPPAIKLRAALEIRHRTGNPLAMVEDGRLVGVIGDEEIYRGILRQTGIAD
jgi:glycine betaine/proline transport system ATP-binding protein